MEEKKDQRSKKKKLAIWTKYLLDIMFYGGIAVTVTLPFSVRKIGELLPLLVEHYEETVIIYFVLGVAAGGCTAQRAAEDFQDRIGRGLLCAGKCGEPAEDGKLELLHSGDVGGAQYRLHDHCHVCGDICICDRRSFQQGACLCL